jgi:hypothetical protein
VDGNAGAERYNTGVYFRGTMESRTQEPEEKKTESAEAVSALSFWLLTPEFCFPSVAI